MTVESIITEHSTGARPPSAPRPEPAIDRMLTADVAGEREPAAILPHGNSDRIFDAIHAHREAKADWDRSWEVFGIMKPRLPRRPEWVAAETAFQAASLREGEAFSALLADQPSTFPGLLALARHLPVAVAGRDCEAADTDGFKALSLLCDTLTWMVRRGTIMANSCPLPDAASPGADVPEDLVEACDWAVRQIDWVNATAMPEDWSDERLDAEMDKAGEVWKRAFVEPSRDLTILAAKARMLRHDWLNADPNDEEHGDRHERMTLKILREINTLASAQGAGDAVKAEAARG